MRSWSVVMGFKVEFPVSVRGDIKLVALCLDGIKKKNEWGASGYGVCVW